MSNKLLAVIDNGSSGLSLERIDGSYARQTIGLEVGYEDSSASTWEKGAISSSSGANSSGSSTNRCRTISYLPKTVNGVGVSNGYKYVLFAYNNGSYIGNWTGSEWTKSSASWHTETIFFYETGDYDYRVVFADYNDATISVNDTENFIFYGDTDPTLTQSGKAADAKATGDAIAALAQEIAALREQMNG